MSLIIKSRHRYPGICAEVARDWVRRLRRTAVSTHPLLLSGIACSGCWEALGSTDPQNKLIRVVNLYDADGIRVGSIATSSNLSSSALSQVTNRWLWDSQHPSGISQIVAATTNDALTERIVYGLGPVAELSLNYPEVGFLVHDALGSVRSRVSAGLELLDQRDYEAFGALLQTDVQNLVVKPRSPWSYGFSGEYYDAQMGLYDHRARFHAPGSSRWLSRDPFLGVVFTPSTLHPFHYAQEDPINRVDPSGRQDYSLVSLFTTSTISGSVAALDTQIATRGHASGRQIARSFVIGAFTGAAGYAVGPVLRIAGAGGRFALHGFALAGGFASVGDAVRQRNSPLAAFRALSFAITHSITEHDGSVRVYRVRGDSKTRVVVTDEGEITLTPDRTLIMNLDSALRAEDYLGRGDRTELSESSDRFTELHPHYLQKLWEESVNGAASARYPGRPIRLEVGRGANALGIPDQEFDQLLRVTQEEGEQGIE